MTTSDERNSQGEPSIARGEDEIRPVGTWVICGLVLFASLANWILVAIILAQQS
jgi:hypothetical protein